MITTKNSVSAVNTTLAASSLMYGEIEGETLTNKQLPTTAYRAAGIFLLGILAIAIYGSFPALLPHFPDAKGVLKPLSMTPTIQLLMLAIATVIMLFCKVKASDVASGSVFKSGMVAIVSVYGVAWMADTATLKTKASRALDS